VQVVGKGRQEPSLQMRSSSSAQPGPVFERRTATGWERLPTIRVGNDIYQVAAASFGDYALVHLTVQPSQAKKSGGINVGLLAGGIAVLVLTLVIVGIRLGRSGSVGSST
jgi:hypothetical protein